jgi:hypothetical protein
VTLVVISSEARNLVAATTRFLVAKNAPRNDNDRGDDASRSHFNLLASHHQKPRARERALAYDDLTHYQKIVVALQETMRVMRAIDAAIPKWPLA